MKAVTFSVIILTTSATAFSQVYVDGKDINKNPDIVYVQIFTAGLKTGLLQSKVYIDIGDGKGHQIEDAEKKPVPIINLTDALNYMARNGWVLTVAYANPGPAQFVMKKRE